jgi:hypothetical protein
MTAHILGLKGVEDNFTGKSSGKRVAQGHFYRAYQASKSSKINSLKKEICA